MQPLGFSVGNAHVHGISTANSSAQAVLRSPSVSLDPAADTLSLSQKTAATPVARKTPWYISVAKEGIKIGAIVGTSLVFGPLAGAGVSGLLSAADQWLSTGKIRVGQTLLDTFLGLIPGGMGSTVAKASTLMFKSLAQQGLKQFIIKGIITGAADGGVLGFIGGFLHTAYEQYAEKKPWDFKAMLQSGVTGATVGFAMGGAMGGAAHGIIHKTGIMPVKPNSLTEAELPKMGIGMQTVAEKMEGHRLGMDRLHIMTGSVKAPRSSTLGHAFVESLEQRQMNVEDLLRRTLDAKNAKGSGSFGSFLEIPEAGFERFGIKIFDQDAPYARTILDNFAIQKKQGLVGGMFRNMFGFDKTAGRILHTQGLLNGKLKVEPLMTRLNGIDHVSQHVAVITNEAGDVVATVMQKVPGKGLLNGLAGFTEPAHMKPYLQRIAEMPQETFDHLVETAAKLKQRGVAVDMQHPGNFIYDAATQRMGLVDIAESAMLGMGHSAVTYRSILEALLGKSNGKVLVADLLASGQSPELAPLVRDIVTKYQAALTKHNGNLSPGVSRFFTKRDRLAELIERVNQPA